MSSVKVLPTYTYIRRIRVDNLLNLLIFYLRSFLRSSDSIPIFPSFFHFLLSSYGGTVTISFAFSPATLNIYEYHAWFSFCISGSRSTVSSPNSLVIDIASTSRSFIIPLDRISVECTLFHIQFDINLWF